MRLNILGLYKTLDFVGLSLALFSIGEYGVNNANPPKEIMAYNQMIWDMGEKRDGLNLSSLEIRNKAEILKNQEYGWVESPEDSAAIAQEVGLTIGRLENKASQTDYFSSTIESRLDSLETTNLAEASKEYDERITSKFVYKVFLGLGISEVANKLRKRRNRLNQSSN